MKKIQPTSGLAKQTKDFENIRKATSHLLKDLDEERAELFLAKAKEDALLASIGDGVMAVDDKETIILMNRAAESLLGYRVEELIGKKIRDVLLLEDASGKKLLEKERPIYANLNESKTVKSDELFYKRKNGTKIPISINGAPIILNKKIIGAVNVFHDITKNKELDKAKDEFIALASHQLNSPITAILWGMQILMGESIGKLNPEQKELMATIIERSKNMADLIAGFLDATRMESSGFDLDKGEADLPKICDSILDEQSKLIADKKLVIKKKYGADVPIQKIGEKTARIILQNLLTNAIKYTPPKGKVHIKIEKNGAGVSIIVKDNGYGIPKEAQSRIFTKLFRAENAKEKEPIGTGLGLYLLKSLVDKLGGKVWFESKENKGSAFYVDLK